MSTFLVKTEPGEYSYDDLVRDRRTTWNGVTNSLALKHIRSMKKGDLAFFYHTGKEKQVVGIAKVVSNPYPDPRRKDPTLVVVDLAPQKKLKNPVSLHTIKSLKKFSTFPLVRIGRLSVMPVTGSEWKGIISLSI